jgi:glucosyl-dolichyl phosphate glucuronosyltransferase
VTGDAPGDRDETEPNGVERDRPCRRADAGRGRQAAAVLLTVAICTWNRAGPLAATLDSLRALEEPCGAGWELLLVDNNSTDGTRRVAGRFADRLPLRYAFEPRQGLSSARNRAVREARGDLVVWTDDDVLVGPGWLRAYADAARQHPDAAFFGGPIEPHWLREPPGWLVRNLHVLGTAFALRHLGPGRRAILEPKELPFGANMAIRRPALAAAGFDPALGRVGAALTSGEETALLRALLARGERGVWLGDAPVRHVLPPSRATRRYVRSYFGWIGRLEARDALARGDPPAPRKLRRRRARLRRQAWLSLSRDEAWAKAFKEAAKLGGALAELAAAAARTP